jgi:hypothetical protein
MPEAILYELRDVTITLLRANNITSGHWFLAVQFGLGAGYIPLGAGGARLPTATIPVLKIGLMQSEEANDVSVDASELSPKPKARKRSSKKTATSSAK